MLYIARIPPTDVSVEKVEGGDGQAEPPAEAEIFKSDHYSSFIFLFFKVDSYRTSKFLVFPSSDWNRGECVFTLGQGSLLAHEGGDVCR